MKKSIKTKAETIREMIVCGVPRPLIAKKVGVGQPYVRAVHARIIGGGLSNADRNYRDKPGFLDRRRTYERNYYSQKSA